MPLETGFDESSNSSNDGVTDPKWLKMFPQCVSDKDKSSNFMTRAMFVAFSMILHRRNILGPEFFSTNYITERLKVKSLNFAHQEAHAISCKLRSAGEAIKHGFLDEIALVVTKHEGDKEAIEVFSFKIVYFEDGSVSAQLNVTQGEDQLSPIQRLGQRPYEGTPAVRDQLIMLARAVHVICHKVLRPLPEVFSANFRISFTSDAPPNYRVEGFFDTSDFYVAHQDMQIATLGQLRPGYHGGIINCSSMFMEDAFHAETILKRHGDKLADELGYANDTLYGSFASDNETRNTSTGVEDLNESHNDSLAKELSLVTLKQNNRTARKPRLGSPKSAPCATHATRAVPYTKGRSRK